MLKSTEAHPMQTMTYILLIQLTYISHKPGQNNKQQTDKQTYTISIFNIFIKFGICRTPITHHHNSN